MNRTGFNKQELALLCHIKKSTFNFRGLCTYMQVPKVLLITFESKANKKKFNEIDDYICNSGINLK
jgi:hypothetical protein